jgi:hypothetical protein
MPSLGSKTLGARGSAGPVKRAEPNFPLEALLNKRAAGASDQPSQMSATLPPPKAMPAERGAATPAAAPRRKPRAPQLARESTGIVQPALVIGIGSLGVETLTQLKKQIAIELGSLDALPQVRLLAIDTDPEAVRAPDDAGPIGVRPQEFFLARLLRASNYLKTRDGKLPTNSWLSPKLLHRIPREQNSAGLRPLGRLAFVDNYRPLARRVEAELQALTCQDTPHDSDPGHELGVRTTRPRVYLATSLTGNTGSGMFIDFAYLVRRILAEQGHEDAEIVGLFYLPAVSRDGTSFAPVASAYASLVELQHYCRPESLFTAHYETAASTVKGGDDATLSGPAFQRCILLPLTEIKGRMDESVNAPLLAQAGAFLYRDLATTLGPVHDEQRNALLDGNEMSAAATLVQSFGMFRIHWPRHAVLEQAARGLSARLVARWMEKDATNLADTIRQWSQERWEALGMRSENLIETFQRCSEASLGQKAELMLAEVLLPVQQALGASSAKQTAGAAKVLVGPIVKAMENLERLIGVPEDSRASRANFEPSTMERVFSDIANDVADGCEQKLAELAVMLLEDPNFRLAGAEEALRQFSQTVEQALQAQEKLAQELTDKARQLYYRLQQLIDMPLKSASPSMSGATTSRPISVSLGKLTPTDLFELVRTYTKTRYHSLVLAHLNRAYVSLRGHLSDQVRDVGFCRTRLGELMGLLHPASLNVRPGAASLERALFPPGCVDLADAAHQLLRSVTPEDLVAFDERVQSWVESHFQALLQVCLGSSSTVRNLAPMIVHEAESYLGERLPAASVAEMYLTRQAAEHEEAADDSIRDDLEKCLEHATSELGSISAHNEFTLVTLPDDEAGKRVAELLRDRHPDAKILFSDRSEEIIFFHETIRIRWKDLEQFGPTAREAYERRSAGDPNSVHSREDVFDWQFVLAGENR